ncbi:MAG: C4-dicarboxylate ABC transporter [Denitrovibrio sp.]|nr:MAG: C4-dicarboxylate ABC transporter [Denitrovibrio sp.]
MQVIETSRMQYFPVTLFSTVMGMAGLGIAFDRYDHLAGADIGVGKYIIYAVFLWFCFLSVIYIIKFFRYPEDVRQEFNHPVKINFFPSVSISMLLLSIGFSSYAPKLATVLCYSGAGLQIIFTYIVINIWFFKDMKLQTINPAWFIPVVGTILVPVAGKGILHDDILWFFFSIGIVLWPILYTLIKYRLIFHEPLPAKFMPTKFIFIAPPAIGFVSYFKLTGGLDPFGKILYFFALFTTIMLFTMIKRFYAVPYFVSWWAYTFPLDAITIATAVMYHLTGNPFYKYLAGFFLVTATLVIISVLLFTILNALKKNICIPES